jgi:hypothetical protein
MPWEETDERAQSEKAEEKEGQTCQVMRMINLSDPGWCVIPVRTLEKANATNVVATISRCMPSPISWAMRVAIM